MYHSPTHLSGHFSADIRSYLRQTKKNIPILFLQGFAGDIRPNNIPIPQSIKQKIQTHLNHQQPFQNFTQTRYQNWLQNIITCFEKLSEKRSHPLKSPLLNLTTLEYKLDSIWDGPTNNQTIRFTAIYLNQKTVIIGVSAEIVSAYSLTL